MDKHKDNSMPLLGSIVFAACFFLFVLGTCASGCSMIKKNKSRTKQESSKDITVNKDSSGTTNESGVRVIIDSGVYLSGTTIWYPEPENYDGLTADDYAPFTLLTTRDSLGNVVTTLSSSTTPSKIHMQDAGKYSRYDSAATEKTSTAAVKTDIKYQEKKKEVSVSKAVSKWRFQWWWLLVAAGVYLLWRFRKAFIHL